MRIIFIAILLGLMGSTFTSLSVVCADDATSLIEGVRLNAMGWRKFDVLIESSNVVDTPERIEERKTVVRLLYDVERERCFCATERSNSITQPQSGGKMPEPVLTVELSSTSVTGSSYQVKSFPGRSAVTVNAKSFADALILTRVPVIEAVGVWDLQFNKSATQKMVLHGI